MLDSGFRRNDGISIPRMEGDILSISIKKGVRKMVRGVACLVFFVLLFSLVTAIAAESDKEMAAVSAAEKWLALIDEGKYSDSWKVAAAFFRNAVPQNQWEQSLLATRKPLGKVLSRSVVAKNYATSLPGAPDGQYVVIRFETSFEHKKQAVETVTPMMDQDGKWHVSGYYIR